MNAVELSKNDFVYFQNQIDPFLQNSRQCFSCDRFIATRDGKTIALSENGTAMVYGFSTEVDANIAWKLICKRAI